MAKNSSSKPLRWLPVQMAMYYKFPLKYTGKNQSIAIISLGGKVDLDELKSSFKELRVPFPNIKLVDVDVKNYAKDQDKIPTYETHLDVEIIGSICPDANITIYRGPNPNGMDVAVAKAIEDNNSVISISWGMPEKTTDKDSKLEAALKSAYERGITVCVATGDGGSSGFFFPGKGIQPLEEGEAFVNYPASSPYVLACGGTELKMESGKSVEVVWNQSDQMGPATGGGVSELFELPSWQIGSSFEIPNANDGKKGRIIPDVAGLAASGDWEIFMGGKDVPMAGTSAVAPLWASFIALANEARATLGKKNLGFLNEDLYKMGAQGGFFNEISQGNNKVGKYPGYTAKPGFNACCGWGTFVNTKLFDALLNLERS